MEISSDSSQASEYSGILSLPQDLRLIFSFYLSADDIQQIAQVSPIDRRNFCQFLWRNVAVLESLPDNKESLAVFKAVNPDARFISHEVFLSPEKYSWYKPQDVRALQVYPSCRWLEYGLKVNMSLYTGLFKSQMDLLNMSNVMTEFYLPIREEENARLSIIPIYGEIEAVKDFTKVQPIPVFSIDMIVSIPSQLISIARPELISSLYLSLQDSHKHIDIIFSTIDKLCNMKKFTFFPGYMFFDNNYERLYSFLKKCQKLEYLKTYHYYFNNNSNFRSVMSAPKVKEFELIMDLQYHRRLTSVERSLHPESLLATFMERTSNRGIPQILAPQVTALTIESNQTAFSSYYFQKVVRRVRFPNLRHLSLQYVPFNELTVNFMAPNFQNLTTLHVVIQHFVDRYFLVDVLPKLSGLSRLCINDPLPYNYGKNGDGTLESMPAEVRNDYHFVNEVMAKLSTADDIPHGSMDISQLARRPSIPIIRCELVGSWINQHFAEKVSADRLQKVVQAIQRPCTYLHTKCRMEMRNEGTVFPYNSRPTLYHMATTRGGHHRTNTNLRGESGSNNNNNDDDGTNTIHWRYAFWEVLFNRIQGMTQIRDLSLYGVVNAFESPRFSRLVNSHMGLKTIAVKEMWPRDLFNDDRFSKLWFRDVVRYRLSPYHEPEDNKGIPFIGKIVPEYIIDLEALNPQIASQILEITKEKPSITQIPEKLDHVFVNKENSYPYMLTEGISKFYNY